MVVTIIVIADVLNTRTRLPVLSFHKIFRVRFQTNFIISFVVVRKYSDFLNFFSARHAFSN